MKSTIGIALDTNIRVKKFASNGSLVEERDFKNVVLDVGWDSLMRRVMDDNSEPEYLFLGTGTTEPSASDPGLESPSSSLPGKPRSNSRDLGAGEHDEDHWWWRTRHRYDYDAGEAEGTWTELGLAYDESYSEPYNRSLFRDENGDPISITVLSDEYLQVFVDLIMYTPTGVVAEGDISYDGQVHTWTVEYDDRTSQGWMGSKTPWHYDSGYLNRVEISGLSNDSDYTYSLTPEEARGELELHVRHGEDFDLGGIILRNDFIWQNTSYRITFDPPLHKKAEDRLFGTMTWQIIRAELPE